MNLVTGHSLVCVLCNSFPFCFSFLGLYLLFFRGLNIRCRFPFCIQSYFSSLLKHLCVHLNTFVCFINHVTLHSTPPATRINSIYIHMLKVLTSLFILMKHYCKACFQCGSSCHNAVQYREHATLCFHRPLTTIGFIVLCNYSLALPYPPIVSNCVDARAPCCQGAAVLCTFLMVAFFSIFLHRSGFTTNS